MSTPAIVSTFDVEYARLPDGALELDVYSPKGATEALPAVIFLHGGGWTFGSRRDQVEERLLPVVRQGVVVASLTYRLTDAATFPGQLHDVKAGIRWLRANAERLGILPDRIGIWGASAGGHLALLAGLTDTVADLEGDLGEHRGVDSSVHAVVSWFAPSDFLTLAKHVPDPAIPPPPFMTGGPPVPSFESRLLGIGNVEEDPERAREASPTHWATQADGSTRFLLMHGTRDGAVPVAQSELMLAALSEAGADATLMLIAGANHEDPAFERPAVLGAVSAFLQS